MAEIRSALAEIGKQGESRHAEVKEELTRQRAEIERVGRQAYLLGQSQRGLSDEVNALPLAWRRFVEKSEARAAAKDPRAEVLAGLMPLKDAFLAAHHQDFVQAEVWRTVFQALEARLDQTLKDLGAQALAQPGTPFDARLHSAVLAAHSEAPQGTVLAVLRQGYALSGSVLRLAEVQVSLGPAPSVARDEGVTEDPSPSPQAHAEATERNPAPQEGAARAQGDLTDETADAGPNETLQWGEEDADADRRD